MILKSTFKFSKSNLKTFKENAIPIEVSRLNIEKLLDKVQNSKSYDSYIDCFEDFLRANPNAVRLNENLIKDGEFYIKSELLEDCNTSKHVLERLKQLNIDMAPEFVNSKSNNVGFGVTVMKIDGSKNGRLLKYSQNKSLISSVAKKKAYEQLVKLANMDIVNADILNHSEVLKVVNGRIICEDWSNLCSKNNFLMTYMPEGTPFDITNKLYEIIYK